MYEVRFYNDQTGFYVKTAGPFSLLDDAADARCVSGDLVVSCATGKVVPDYSWLWMWEKNKSYAKDKIDAAIHAEGNK